MGPCLTRQVRLYIKSTKDILYGFSQKNKNKIYFNKIFKYKTQKHFIRHLNSNVERKEDDAYQTNQKMGLKIGECKRGEHAQGEGGHNRMFASVRGTRGPAKGTSIVYENCMSP